MLIIQKCLTLQTAIQPNWVCKCIHLKIVSCSLCIGWQTQQSRTLELCRNWLQRRCNFLLSSSWRNLRLICQSAFPHKLHLYIVQFQMLIIQKWLTLQTAIQPNWVCKCIHLKILSCSLCIGWQTEQSRTFELCRNWLQRRCNFLLSTWFTFYPPIGVPSQIALIQYPIQRLFLGQLTPCGRKRAFRFVFEAGVCGSQTRTRTMMFLFPFYRDIANVCSQITHGEIWVAAC